MLGMEVRASSGPWSRRERVVELVEALRESFSSELLGVWQLGEIAIEGTER